MVLYATQPASRICQVVLAAPASALCGWKGITLSLFLMERQAWRQQRQQECNTYVSENVRGFTLTPSAGFMKCGARLMAERAYNHAHPAKAIKSNLRNTQ